MSRLIDADAIPYTMLYKENWLKGTGVEKPGVWKDTIDAMPTIKPERAKGEWLADTNEFDEWYCCSVCHKGLTMFDGTYDFCPHCGADMRGDSE